MKQAFKLTKEEFITRSMAGDVFEFKGNTFYYDNNEKSNPFRLCQQALSSDWDKFNGINEFTLVEPEPEMESWAEFRVWNCNNNNWYKSSGLYRTLIEFKETYYQTRYSHHHEIEGSRVLLPKVV